MLLALAAAGLGAAVAVAAVTTGNGSACADATLGSDVQARAGCTTVTNVVRTQTVTTSQKTARSTSTDSSTASGGAGSHASAPGPGWTTVVDDEFDSGNLPPHWRSYTGFYRAHPARSATPNCVAPSQATVRGGYLHLLMQWKTGICGDSPFTGWWTAGLKLSLVPSLDATIALRWRIVSRGVISHHVIPMRWPERDDRSYGEQDWCESSSLTTCTSFLHYGQGSADRQISHDYRVDMGRWHTWRVVEADSRVAVYIDNLATPVWKCDGNTSPACNAETVPRTLKHVVLQQECAGIGQACPSNHAGSEDIEIDWLTVATRNR